MENCGKMAKEQREVAQYGRNCCNTEKKKRNKIECKAPLAYNVTN